VIEPWVASSLPAVSIAFRAESSPDWARGVPGNPLRHWPHSRSHVPMRPVRIPGSRLAVNDEMGEERGSRHRFVFGSLSVCFRFVLGSFLVRSWFVLSRKCFVMNNPVGSFAIFSIACTVFSGDRQPIGEENANTIAGIDIAARVRPEIAVHRSAHTQEYPMPGNISVYIETKKSAQAVICKWVNPTEEYFEWL
jgi:hypothetical protein